MDVKEAISTAKSYVKDVFSEDEPISNLGLEEVEFDHRREEWKITLGFSRPWSTPRTRAREIFEGMGGTITPHKRVQKVLTVSDSDGRVLAMKNRETEA
ncbi:hypothetical protein [uncultured Enterovirga sp.]|uniref:hypothetical protein n=1 Tax=uncultured Enterovirga sp. TaxID=2026352 RepID=UPI0035C9C6F3